MVCGVCVRMSAGTWWGGRVGAVGHAVSADVWPPACCSSMLHSVSLDALCKQGWSLDWFLEGCHFLGGWSGEVGVSFDGCIWLTANCSAAGCGKARATAHDLAIVRQAACMMGVYPSKIF
jgi:hypothetical protein